MKQFKGFLPYLTISAIILITILGFFVYKTNSARLEDSNMGSACKPGFSKSLTLKGGVNSMDSNSCSTIHPEEMVF